MRDEVSPFGIDVALVQPGPFGTGLLAGGKAPDREDVLASYGDLAGVSTAMGYHFATFLLSDEAPKSQLVIDTYLELADMPAGTSAPRVRFLASPGEWTK
ncbi:MAG: hypothetical protein ACKO50_00580 [Cyanobium sp.]